MALVEGMTSPTCKAPWFSFPLAFFLLLGLALILFLLALALALLLPLFLDSIDLGIR